MFFMMFFVVRNKTRGGSPVLSVGVTCVVLFGGGGEEICGCSLGSLPFPGVSQLPWRMQGFAQCLAHIRSCHQAQRQAAAGWGRGGKERRARQLRAAEKVFHGSYLQPSKELQRLPIKTLLKHF